MSEVIGRPTLACPDVADSVRDGRPGGEGEQAVMPATAMSAMARRRAGQALVLAAFAVACALLLLLNVALGSVRVPLADAARVVLGDVRVDSTYFTIVHDIRLPRALAALACGAALAVSGLLLQVFFRNPIVGPDILGVSSGARLAVSLVMLGGISLGAYNPSPVFVTAVALVGAVAVLIVVVGIAGRVRDIITLLVIGLMVGYIASAFTSFLVAFAESERLYQFTIWTLGSFSGFRWDQVRVTSALIAVLLTATGVVAKPLNAFLLGERYAQSMGVDVKLFRYFLIVVSGSLAGIVTAFAGPVAFIGLAVPHLARLCLGTSDSRTLVPGAILLGAALTSLCDLVAKTAFAPTELPISAATSLFGAPIVIAMLMRRRMTLHT